MSNNTNPQVPDSELRHKIHLLMLAKSDSATKYADLTVVPLGYAVTIAIEQINKAVDAALVKELKMVDPIASHKLAATVEHRIGALQSKATLSTSDNGEEL